MTELEKQLYDALSEAWEHLNWIGYGDSYERECFRENKIGTKIETALKAAEEKQ